MKRLQGRGCIVTGASGMAADAAQRFAAEGAHVVVLAKEEAECRALGLPYVLVDLTSESQTERAFAEARARLPRVDAVYAVAGSSGRRDGDGPLHELTLRAWESTFARNATPAFLAAREAVRAMLDQPAGERGERGSVVIMTSVLASAPAGLFATHAYAAAKAATVGLVRATAARYAADGIRVNAIAPALVRTPMAARAAADPASIAYAARRQALTGGFLDPADVTGTALHLCSAESRGTTGQVVVVDGGWSVLDASDPPDRTTPDQEAPA